MRNILLAHQDKSSRENLAAALRRDIECVVLETDSAETASEIL